ncbi:MAG: type II secretion system protein [Candidatus Paceibacterota bacterium]
MQKKYARRRGGFTLIELLVVIAIIGVLSSIILPSLNVARARARDANRVAQMQQIRTALELYFSDHGEYPIDGCKRRGEPLGCGCNSFYDVGDELSDLGYLGDSPRDPQDPDMGPSECYQYQNNYAGPSCGGVMSQPNYYLLFKGETSLTSDYTPWVETTSGYRCLRP